MNFNKWLGALCACFLIISCGENTSKQQEEYDEVFQEVMHVHDKMMVRMSDIYEYSKQLKTAADTSDSPQAFATAREELQESDEDMMNWMEHFGDEFVKDKNAMKSMDQQQLEKRTEALRNELSTVETMQEEMSARLKRAEQLLQ